MVQYIHETCMTSLQINVFKDVKTIKGGKYERI